jgi:hypothetical protein
MGWSMGTATAMPLFSDPSLISPELYALLEPYVKNLVLYGASGTSQGMRFSFQLTTIPKILHICPSAMNFLQTTRRMIPGQTQTAKLLRSCTRTSASGLARTLTIQTCRAPSTDWTTESAPITQQSHHGLQRSFRITIVNLLL